MSADASGIRRRFQQILNSAECTAHAVSRSLEPRSAVPTSWRR